MFSRDSKSGSNEPSSITPNSSPSSTPNSTPSSAPTSAWDKPTATVPSIISRGLKITGDLKSGGDVQIDGIIEGNIDCRLLTIGQGGEMHGSITAETVRVSGKVEGQLKAKSVTLHKTAEMIGDITHGNLAIEAGAQIDGRISRMQNAGKGDKIASSDPEISARNSAATVQ